MTCYKNETRVNILIWRQRWILNKYRDGNGTDISTAGILVLLIHCRLGTSAEAQPVLPLPQVPLTGLPEPFHARSLVKTTLFYPRDSVNRTLFIFRTGTVTPLDGILTLYSEPLFLPRAMTRFPLTTFHCWFLNFTSCPCSSNCLTEIKLFIKLWTTLTSFKVQKPTGVFNTTSHMPVTSRVLLFASLTFPKSPINRFYNASLLWVAWNEVP